MGSFVIAPVEAEEKVHIVSRIQNATYGLFGKNAYLVRQHVSAGYRTMKRQKLVPYCSHLVGEWIDF
jgi:hypothetical protein